MVCSSRGMGWPTHTIRLSRLTRKATGMPLRSAASIRVTAIAPLLQFGRRIPLLERQLDRCWPREPKHLT
jgi:hypothetical protein